MKTSTLRLRNIWMKNGGASVSIIYPSPPEEPEDLRREFTKEVSETLELHTSDSDIAGYAIVLWGRDHTATSTIRSLNDGGLPHLMIPDYVRSILMATEIKHGIRDDVYDDNPSPLDGA